MAGVNCYLSPVSCYLALEVWTTVECYHSTDSPNDIAVNPIFSNLSEVTFLKFTAHIHTGVLEIGTLNNINQDTHDLWHIT